MKRILFVSTSTTIGGAEKTLYCLATRLDPQRFDVAGVVSLKPYGAYAQRLEDKGVALHTLHLEGLPSWKTVSGLAEIIERVRPDIVHALMYQAIELSRLVKRRSAVPFKLISSPRVNYRTRPVWSLWIDRLLKNADDLLISESSASRNFLVQEMGYAPDKVRVIYNGIDAPVAMDKRQAQRFELQAGANEFLIGTVGRIDRQKGHELLVRAMVPLKNTGMRCLIIGDGPGREKLGALIRELDLASCVWLMGERTDVPAWLSALDLFVLPSRWEGLPNSLLEAMSLGLPVVATAVDGISEVVTDGSDGVLVPPENSSALTAAIQHLRADADLRLRLGQTARATVAQRFTIEKMIAAYETTYAEILAQPGPKDLDQDRS